MQTKSTLYLNSAMITNVLVVRRYFPEDSLDQFHGVRVVKRDVNRNIPAVARVEPAALDGILFSHDHVEIIVKLEVVRRNVAVIRIRVPDYVDISSFQQSEKPLRVADTGKCMNPCARKIRAVSDDPIIQAAKCRSDQPKIRLRGT